MLSTQFNRDNQYQAITKPSLLAGCIALALLPSAAFAAPATEETVIVEGSATAPDDGENDYSVTSTSAGTKIDAPRDKCAHFREINGIAAAFQHLQKNYIPAALSFL